MTYCSTKQVPLLLLYSRLDLGLFFQVAYPYVCVTRTLYSYFLTVSRTFNPLLCFIMNLFAIIPYIHFENNFQFATTVPLFDILDEDMLFSMQYLAMLDIDYFGTTQIVWYVCLVISK